MTTQDECRNALFAAIRAGQADAAGHILDKNPELISATDSTDAFEGQPLHLAADCGNKDMLTLLLDRGADVNARDKCGRQPIHLAARVSSPEAADLLIRKGAQIDAQDINGMRPLHWAAVCGNMKIIAFLAEKGAHLGKIPEKGVSLDTLEKYPPDIMRFLKKRLDKITDPDERDAVDFLKKLGIQVPAPQPK